MPADLFLKLGNVKGESVDLKHAGEMELLPPHFMHKSVWATWC